MSNSLAATFLLAVWILSPLLAVLHVALEDHVYCAEHQRLEETADAHSPAFGLAKATADAQRTELLSQALLSEAHQDEPLGEHGACAFVDDFRRDGVHRELAVFGLPAPLACPELATPIASSAGSSIPLLRVAPKNSPPLTA